MDRDPAIRWPVHPDVYPPSTDTWLLLHALDVGPRDRVLDVGTGTGVLALHAARAGGRTVATDVSPHACRTARRAAADLGLDLDVVRCDLFRGLRGRFDVVVFNPPYLPSPRLGTSWAERAWGGGPGGEAVTLRFLDGLADRLASAGRAYVLLARANRRALEAAEARFRVRPRGAARLFFERLVALELRHPSDEVRDPLGRPAVAEAAPRGS